LLTLKLISGLRERIHPKPKDVEQREIKTLSILGVTLHGFQFVINQQVFKLESTDER
jgi:hypothetical protein